MKEELIKTLAVMLERTGRPFVIVEEQHTKAFVQFVPKDGGILVDVPEQVGMHAREADEVLPLRAPRIGAIPLCRQRLTSDPEEAALVAALVFERAFGITDGAYQIVLDNTVLS